MPHYDQKALKPNEGTEIANRRRTVAIQSFEAEIKEEDKADATLFKTLADATRNLVKDTIETWEQLSPKICTEAICPEMSGGPTYKYLWADGEKIKKPIAVSAPQYVKHLKEWANNLVNNGKVFPKEINADTAFPNDFLLTVKTIMRRLFRVYVHLYHFHHQKFVLVGTNDQFNQHFKDFYKFITQHSLVDPIERKPIQPLIDSLESEVPPAQNSSLQMAANADEQSFFILSKENPTSEKKQLKLLVEHEGLKKRCDIAASSLEELTAALRQRLELSVDFIVEYFDEDFSDFVLLEDFNALSEKARLKVKKLTNTLRLSGSGSNINFSKSNPRPSLNRTGSGRNLASNSQAQPSGSTSPQSPRTKRLSQVDRRTSSPNLQKKPMNEEKK
eukprot:TRINITY_DN4519_c1_g1_i1.p2 TRINITY_DN4519_c1_g1~~TRINITY_DN4519_c1_g1_i1.p2  ORF type:complete len:389 (-),score=96.91 TRINITY_DN4519_c1_g1_i1:7-1173(-)